MKRLTKDWIHCNDSKNISAYAEFYIQTHNKCHGGLNVKLTKGNQYGNGTQISTKPVLCIFNFLFKQNIIIPPPSLFSLQLLPNSLPLKFTASFSLIIIVTNVCDYNLLSLFSVTCINMSLGLTVW